MMQTITQACGHKLTWRPWRAGETDYWGHTWTAHEEAQAIERYRQGSCLKCHMAQLKRAQPIRLPRVAW
jgi:hypothetical protein